MPNRFFFFLLVGSLSLTTAFAQSDFDFTAYDTYLQEEVAQGHLAGAVSLVYKNGEVIHDATYGYADREAEETMAKDQVFHIMSMTKPLVTLAAMQLWEDGHFKLDDPIADHLDGFTDLRVTKDPTAGKDGPSEPVRGPITIRQLMTHTAGFSHGLGGSQLDREFGMAMYFMPQKDLASRVATLTSFPLSVQPGTKWNYSASPDVLALLVEKYSGVTMDSFLRARILEPLGMNNTGYNLPEPKAARLAKLYKTENGKLVRDMFQMPAAGNTVFGGSHGLVSTAPDYARFCAMLLNEGRFGDEQIIEPATLELMQQNHLGDVPFAPGKGFALGFGVVTETPADGIGSPGTLFWSGYYNTFFFVDPVQDMFAILMTQQSGSKRDHGAAMWKHVYGAVAK